MNANDFKFDKASGQVETGGGLVIGHLVLDIDGFYKYMPMAGRNGYWTAENLLALGAFIKGLNKPWEDQIARELG